MAKKKTLFVCNECGSSSPKWLGRCPACGEWNTFTEEKEVEEKEARVGARKQTSPLPLTEIPTQDVERFRLGMDELDTVLGGGIVPGSSLLLGGEPGIGKSTLLLQAAKLMGEKHGRVLYITGEESAQQVRMRAERLGALSPQVLLLAETDIDHALDEAAKYAVSLIILDSVQAVFTEDFESAPGSVSQVRTCAAKCVDFARKYNAAVFLVGHVTKEGMLAGPRVLEHMVDTVLYFEGERNNSFRILRAVKNRFGSTNEIAVFEMREEGLTPFSDPSGFFLAQRPENIAGSVVSCIMQGSRPLLLEVQALTASTAFGNPRRLAAGMDYNRLLIIVAVLERKLGFSLSNQDIYINIAGGMKIDDPACDLAVACAIASSVRAAPIEEGVVIMGEIGLLGEVRGISHPERRIKEAARFGFNKPLLPKANKNAMPSSPLLVDNAERAMFILGLDN